MPTCVFSVQKKNVKKHGVGRVQVDHCIISQQMGPFTTLGTCPMWVGSVDYMAAVDRLR